MIRILQNVACFAPSGIRQESIRMIQRCSAARSASYGGGSRNVVWNSKKRLRGLRDFALSGKRVRIQTGLRRSWLSTQTTN